MRHVTLFGLGFGGHFVYPFRSFKSFWQSFSISFIWCVFGDLLRFERNRSPNTALRRRTALPSVIFGYFLNVLVQGLWRKYGNEGRRIWLLIQRWLFWIWRKLKLLRFVFVQQLSFKCMNRTISIKNLFCLIFVYSCFNWRFWRREIKLAVKVHAKRV
jgi:hypothetical protein